LDRSFLYLELLLIGVWTRLFRILLIGRFFSAMSSLLGLGAVWDRDTLVLRREHLDH